MIEKSLDYLIETSLLAPVFEKQKSNLVSEISLLYKNGELEEKNRLLSSLKKLFGFSTRYLILQPNIAGLGININKIADDLVSESNKKNQSDA